MEEWIVYIYNKDNNKLVDSFVESAQTEKGVLKKNKAKLKGMSADIFPISEVTRGKNLLRKD